MNTFTGTSEVHSTQSGSAGEAAYNSPPLLLPERHGNDRGTRGPGRAPASSARRVATHERAPQRPARRRDERARQPALAPERGEEPNRRPAAAVAPRPGRR